MSSLLADLIAPSCISPNAGEGESCGSQPMSTAVYKGAQIIFRDLTPYLINL